MYGQIFGFILGFLSAVGATVTCLWSHWCETSGQSNTPLLSSISGYGGIWIQCIEYTSGQFQCDDYSDSDGNLSIYINTIRGFMCVSIISTILGCFVALTGMQCTQLFDSNKNFKRKCMFISATIFMISGMLVLASAAWFAAMILSNFFSANNQDGALEYSFGDGIWFGASSSVLCFITSAIFFCAPGPAEKGLANVVASLNLDSDSLPPYKCQFQSDSEYI